MLKITEIFASIQGEGSQSGMPMTFIRLSGCNLRCKYCDTKNSWKEGKLLSEDYIIDNCIANGLPWVCLTGGEPLIQDTEPLIRGLLRNGFKIAIETNGTQSIPPHLNHVTISPKRNEAIHEEAHRHVTEWKYIIQDKSDFERIGQKENVFLQPVDNDVEIAKLCVEKILENKGWRLSLQIHKLIGVK